MLKIDLSTIALILFLVLPGLVAKKSQRKIYPRSFEAAGPATELGELVAFSLSAHLLLLASVSTLGLLAGLATHAAAYYFKLADRFDLYRWYQPHRVEAALATAAYLCVSVFTGYLLGIFNGWLRLNHPLSRFMASTSITRYLRRLGILSLLEERPLSFDLFTGEAAERRTDLIYFLEVQLREDRGFITGELVKYAIVKDEEAHRPVVLRDAQFKLTAGDTYTPMEGDRVLIDLADALLVQVSYRERAQAIAEMEEDPAGAWPGEMPQQ